MGQKAKIGIFPIARYGHTSAQVWFQTTAIEYHNKVSYNLFAGGESYLQFVKKKKKKKKIQKEIKKKIEGKRYEWGISKREEERAQKTRECVQEYT